MSSGRALMPLRSEVANPSLKSGLWTKSAAKCESALVTSAGWCPVTIVSDDIRALDKTGQPDFGEIKIQYIADARCVELKSLKLYLQTFRSKGIYYEDVTNVLLDDLVACLQPRWMKVKTTWSIRGGIHTVVIAEHGTRQESPD